MIFAREMKRTAIINKILMALALMLPLAGNCQPGPGGPPSPAGSSGGPPCTPFPECLPIDNGIIFLMIFGVGLVLFQIWRTYYANTVRH